MTFQFETNEILTVQILIKISEEEYLITQFNFFNIKNVHVGLTNKITIV